MTRVDKAVRNDSTRAERGRPSPFPTPALDLWRRELAEGKRGLDVTDPLWRAACWEISALEAHAAGMHEAALRDRQCAIDILRMAATG